MKRGWTWLLGASITLGGAYVYYLESQGDYSITGFAQWLQSLLARTALGGNALVGNYIDKAVSFIANQEGFSGKAYADPPGQSSTYSIGYGHQIIAGDGLNTASVIDEAQARELLNADVQSAADCVASYAPSGLSDNQFAALISFTYNEGCTAFKSSTLLRLLNNGDTQGAAAEFSRWVYAQGQVLQALVNRRGAEQQLFLS